MVDQGDLKIPQRVYAFHLVQSLYAVCLCLVAAQFWVCEFEMSGF